MDIAPAVFETAGPPIVDIPHKMVQRWHGLVRSCVETAHVDAAWITRLDRGRAELMTIGTSTDVSAAEEASLLRWTRPFRERIVAQRGMVITDPAASNGENGIVGAHLGLPVLLPDGALFGTFETIGRTGEIYSDARKRLIARLRDVVEDYLSFVVGETASARRQAEMAVERERLTLAVQVGNIGIWDYHIAADRLYCDPRWHDIVGRDLSDPVRSIRDWRPHVHPDDRARVTEGRMATLAELKANREVYKSLFRIVRPDGEIRWLSSTAHLIDAAGIAPDRLVGFIMDITEQRRAAEKLAEQHQELERLSLEDPLTGIANRRQFEREFERACRQAARTQEALGLAILDVDHFKQYNDTYGHGPGDAALRAVGRALSRFARRPYDVVARYGGEEFVVLLPDVADFPQLLEDMRRSVEALGIAHRESTVAAVVTVSIGGVLVAGGQSAEPAGLLERADAALYAAKRAGRNRVVLAGHGDGAP